MPKQVDLLVIGGGPAGYCGAIRARQLGKSVVLAERDAVGGTCLNRGCIPTKALLESAHLYDNLSRMAEHGVEVSYSAPDLSQVVSRKNGVVQRLVQGLAYLLKQKGVEVLPSEAEFLSPSTVRIGDEVYEPERILVATGTAPADLPNLVCDGKLILNSDQMLDLARMPRTLVIVGGGVIGCEFATVFSAYGVQVTIVEIADTILPMEDKDLSKTLMREFRKNKVKVLTSAQVRGVEPQADGTGIVKVEYKGRVEELAADCVLVSVGRKPVLPKGFPGDVDKRGYITVNTRFQTSVPEIYAAGDVIGGVQLAHLAFEEGMAAIEFAFGGSPKSKWEVPRCVYTQPEIAAVGMTEEQARAVYGDELQIGQYTLKGNGRAVISGLDSGFCKIIADRSGRVLGVHMIGPQATEIIAGATTVLEHHIALHDWAETIHPHPTVAESVREAVLAALGRGLHSV
ncbi:MAG: dihydrolipoyl dehydrogenase [Firmicutes bacterium]|jgi:dihydrolipoamide dehydrogenase|nr:dihydrolipoyl dehydrogenase [Bacillota bacterium]